jgi:hypothetical protein
MVWYGEVHFQQRVVTELLVAKKQSVMNIHKQLKNMQSVNAVNRSTVLSLGSGLHKMQVLRKAKWSSVMHVALAGQQQILRCCFNMLMNSFKMTNGLQPERLHLSSQHPRKVSPTLLMH